MRKRTSDFMALAAILGGAGLGLGLTSLLYAESRVDRVPQADDSSVSRRAPGAGSYIRYRGGRSLDVEVLRRSKRVVPGRIADSSEEVDVVRHALIVEMDRSKIGVTPEGTAPRFRMRTRVRANGLDRAQLERLRAQVEELRREAGELDELKELAEALEAVEALENLDLGQNLTIDIFRSDDDERRRRRRGRRPPWAAEGPDSDAPGTKNARHE